MNLDLSYFEFIQKEELRVLTAIEMGMRNHEWVPVKLIEKIADLKRGNGFKVIQILLKHKLIAHSNDKKFEGYKLNYSGYDYLALSKFKKIGLISKIESKIGVGKESDIYLVRSEEDKLMVLKLARLGRRSFKTVKNNRDYLQGRTQFNWLYLSRLASTREFNYMTILYEHGFPVPVPVSHNRHAILMGFVNGFPL
jgi:RIO kinase 2